MISACAPDDHHEQLFGREVGADVDDVAGFTEPVEAAVGDRFGDENPRHDRHAYRPAGPIAKRIERHVKRAPVTHSAALRSTRYGPVMREAASMTAEFEIRTLDTPDEMAVDRHRLPAGVGHRRPRSSTSSCCGRSRTPAATCRAIYDRDRLMGASFGFLARHHGEDALHSHITGILPGVQHGGAGRAMKLHQRDWAAARDIPWITWTFDPLVRRNAWFNIEVLGAHVSEYLVNFYGPMTDSINAHDESDRLVVAWPTDPAMRAPPAPPSGSTIVEVATPDDIVVLRRTDPDRGTGVAPSRAQPSSASESTPARSSPGSPARALVRATPHRDRTGDEDSNDSNCGGSRSTSSRRSAPASASRRTATSCCCTSPPTSARDGASASPRTSRRTRRSSSRGGAGDPRAPLAGAASAATSAAADVAPALARFKGHPMSKGALEMAVLDAELRANGISLQAGVWARPATASRAASASASSTRSTSCSRQVAGYIADGYVRIKLKIEPGWDIEPVRLVRELIGPDVPLQVDANTAYGRDDIAHLCKLDEFDLLLIEQPLPEEDILGHAQLARASATPVCLDESIVSVHTAVDAIDLGAAEIINIKPGRVGGYLEAVRIHDLCVERGVPGVVRRHGRDRHRPRRQRRAGLAARFTLPGDISASTRFYARDIVIDPITVVDGHVDVPTTPGLGFELDHDFLDAITTSTVELTVDADRARHRRARLARARLVAIDDADGVCRVGARPDIARHRRAAPDVIASTRRRRSVVERLPNASASSVSPPSHVDRSRSARFYAGCGSASTSSPQSVRLPALSGPGAERCRGVPTPRR